VRGHLRERSPGRWAIVLDVRDPTTGKRKRRWHSFAGSKRQAQKECARLIAAQEQGSYVEPSRTAVADFVAARVDQWESAGDITARTAARYRSLIKHQISAHIGDKPLQKLSRLDVEGWHTALRSTVSPRTIGHVHRLVAKALDDAARDGLVVKNVCRIQRAPRVVEADMTIVQDVPAFVALLREHAGRLYAPAIVALSTGMRLSEVLALRERSVDLDKGIIEVREALEETTAHGVRFKAPKSKAGRRNITLPAIAIEALREHRRQLLELRFQLGQGKLGPDDLLFATVDGRPLRPSAVSGDWGELAERIGMPDVTFHGLRHTHASQLITGGMDIVTLSKRLGHAKPDITLRVYAHQFTVDDSRAAAIIDAAIR
jgi:integrase